MNRKPRSPIWKLPKDDLIKLVSESDSISKVLKFFGIENKGGNYKTLKRRLDSDGIDYSHIKNGLNSNKGRKFFNAHKIPTSEILVKNSKFNRYYLKDRLIKEKLINHECSECKINNIWNDKPLSLQLDHINGINDDNRLENLRFLCPNCHSQTPTFAGRSLRIKNNCETCGKSIKIPSKKCFKCNMTDKNFSKRKVVRPDKEILLKQVSEFGYVGTGKLYGVSDNAVRKWLK